MNIHAFATQYLNGLKEVLDGFDHACFKKIVTSILDAYEKEKYIFVMGNGGSGATASHFACDINKGCCMDLDKKFKMFCLNDNIPTLLALANDVSYDVVFEEQLKNFFRPLKLLLVLQLRKASIMILIWKNLSRRRLFLRLKRP